MTAKHPCATPVVAGRREEPLEDGPRHWDASKGLSQERGSDLGRPVVVAAVGVGVKVPPRGGIPVDARRGRRVGAARPSRRHLEAAAGDVQFDAAIRRALGVAKGPDEGPRVRIAPDRQPVFADSAFDLGGTP